MNRLGFVCGETLSKLANSDRHLWVIDGDLADSDGAEPFALAHPDRFVAAGIAEQSMVSIAAGLASCGKRPWVFSFAAFLCYRAYDQIRVGVSQTNLPVVLVGSHAGGCGGRNGKTHIAINDIAVMASLPGIGIWTPGDAVDTHTAVREISDNREGGAYLRLPRCPVPLLPFRQDKDCAWIGEPSEIAMISCGMASQWAVQAQTILADTYGLKAGIIHIRKIWPLVPADLLPLLAGVRHAIVLDDHYEFGGLATCLRTALPTPPLSPSLSLEHWGWPAGWCGQSGSEADLLSAHGLHPEDLARRIKNLYTR